MMSLSDYVRFEQTLKETSVWELCGSSCNKDYYWQLLLLYYLFKEVREIVCQKCKINKYISYVI